MDEEEPVPSKIDKHSNLNLGVTISVNSGGLSRKGTMNSGSKSLKR